MSGYECCGTDGACMPRSFLTKEEKIEMLRTYKDHLSKEAKGIQERIEQIERS